ncbi:hypothetical protein ACH9DO_05095 [Kocuria sp. M1N1S27]|uniref:hypothetical protein n=1 Tax=Kocuria kalidii TaxID=3376283 RepID=UPI0037B4B71C
MDTPSFSVSNTTPKRAPADRAAARPRAEASPTLAANRLAGPAIPSNTAAQRMLITAVAAHAGNSAAGQIVARCADCGDPGHTTTPPGSTPTSTGGLPDDAELAAGLRSQTGMDGLFLLARLEGLQGARVSHPQTYSLIRSRVSAREGPEAFAWALQNDHRILLLVRNAEALQDRASALMQDALERDQIVAYERIWDLAREKEFGYAKAFDGYRQAGPLSLEIFEFFLAGTVHEQALALEQAGQAAQEDADERVRLAAGRTAAGRTLVGRHIASKEMIAWFDTDLTLVDLLAPQDGFESYDVALASARVSDTTAAVTDVGDRWYVYRLSVQYSYADLWEHRVLEEGRSALITFGGLRPTLVTSDGYVLVPRGSRYFGGTQTRDPGRHLAADESLLEQRGETLGRTELLRLFRQMTLDLVLLNLSEAEGRLNVELRKLFPTGLLSPEAGGELQAQTSALRRHLLAASEMASQEGPDDDVGVGGRLAETLIAIGRISQESPTAVLMVRDTRDADETGAAQPDEIVDSLAGKRSGDAGLEAARELRERLENVRKIRRHLHRDPDAVFAFKAMHDQVLPRFTSAQQQTLRVGMMFRDLAEIASAVGIAAGEMTLLVAGLATGGTTALVAMGLGAVSGAAVTAEGFADAQRLAAMTELDVSDDFALATPEQAASARNWALIGLGLSVLDLAGFMRGARQLGRVRRLLRAPELHATLGGAQRDMRSIARGLGMNERALVRDLETLRGPARDALLLRVRQAAGTMPGGGRASQAGRRLHNFLGMADDAVETLRRELLNRDDAGTVLRSLREAGVAADLAAVRRIKAYLFDSPGIMFEKDNYKAWMRLARFERAVPSVDDVRMAVHEMAELNLLQRVQGFDMLGRGYDQMTRSQRASWRAKFNYEYFRAHQKALEAEYDFLADQVRRITNGRVSEPRHVVAAVDPTREEARLYMLMDGKPLIDHRDFYAWASRTREVVEVGRGARDRLWLPSKGDVRLGELIQAVKDMRLR